MEGQNSGWQDKLKGLWGNLTSVQRIAIFGGVAVALALVIYTAVLAQTPDYGTLFSGLSEEDAASVVDQLKTSKIPYKLEQGGAVIQVPQNQVYEVRLEMAKQGLPKGSTVGFEMFDGGQLSNFGMTDFMQRLQYQRALEGELARTIGSLEPVSSARVHLVIPEPNLYSSEEKTPTASVVVQLKPNADLTRGQVQAVTHLVASSVEGLKPGNITLVDVAGNVLSAGGDISTSDSLQAGTSQMDIERNYEQNLERKLQAVLDQAVGPNQGIVRVSAALNWDQKQTNSETYAPASDNAGVIRSEQIQEEAPGGNTLQAGGVPGQDSNTIPGYPAGTAITNTTGLSKLNTTRNYEVSKVVQTVTQAPGSVKRLSLAVLLSDQVPADQATRLQSMLVAAAGLDTTRGDTVALERIPFGNSELSTTEPTVLENLQSPTTMGLLRLAGLLVAILLLLRFARLTFSDLASRLAGSSPHVTVVEDRLPAPAAHAPGLPDPGIAQALPQASQEIAEEAPALPPVVDPEQDRWRQDLRELAARRPEVIADIIQNWLTEG